VIAREEKGFEKDGLPSLAGTLENECRGVF